MNTSKQFGAPVAISVSPASPTVGDPYALAFAAYPGTVAKLDKNAAKQKFNGKPMTRAQYVAFLVSKDVGTR